MTLHELASHGILNNDGRLPTMTEVATEGWWPYSEGTAASGTSAIFHLIGMCMVFAGLGIPISRKRLKGE